VNQMDSCRIELRIVVQVPADKVRSKGCICKDNSSTLNKDGEFSFPLFFLSI